jgi:hypothetical protein
VSCLFRLSCSSHERNHISQTDQYDEIDQTDSPRRSSRLSCTSRALRSMHGDFPKGGSYTSKSRRASMRWMRLL